MSLIIENGDCLELMKSLPDNSVDLFICDLPYGETNCKWDSKIDLEQFWEQFRRLRKSKRTACIHFCSTKFGYTLIKSWEGGYKMDMVWKKRNKTGGLQSRNRPMRNHEMVYFFYEQAPKYNRDKYHKRIVAQPKTSKYTEKVKKGYGYETGPGIQKNKKGDERFPLTFEPPNPASVVEEKDTIYNKNTIGWSSSENNKTYLKANPGYTPRQPGSVLEEEDQVYSKKGWKHGGQANSKEYRDNMKAKGLELKYEPPNPGSVLEEEDQDRILTDDNRFLSKSAYKGSVKETMKDYKNRMGSLFDPKQPTSVVIPAEDEPVSMFESTKVFIGKRHHQTEKPQDILEFFIKYWTDEGDTILDPTMGSGSTGVACNKLKRNFIGFELDETIFKVAEKRVNTKVI